ncbi:hypothetical protein VPHD528_0040 [Vibrio phage D528]
MALFKQLVESDDQLLTEAFNSKPYETTMTKKGAGDVFFTFEDEDGKEFRVQFYTSGGLGKSVRRVYVGEKQGNVYKDAIKTFKNPMRVIATMIKSTEDYLQTPLGKSIQGLAVDLSAKAAPKGRRLIQKIMKRSVVIKKHLDVLDSDLTVDPGRGVVWTVRKGVDPATVFDGKKVAGMLGSGDVAGKPKEPSMKDKQREIAAILLKKPFEEMTGVISGSYRDAMRLVVEVNGNVVISKGGTDVSTYEFRKNESPKQFTARISGALEAMADRFDAGEWDAGYRRWKDAGPATVEEPEFDLTLYQDEVTQAIEAAGFKITNKLTNTASSIVHELIYHVSPGDAVIRVDVSDYDDGDVRFTAFKSSSDSLGLIESSSDMDSIDDVKYFLEGTMEEIEDSLDGTPELAVGQNIIDAFELDDNGEGGYEADIGDDDWLEVKGSEWSLSYASNDAPYASGSVNDSGAIDAIKRAVKGRTQDNFDSLDDTPPSNIELLAAVETALKKMVGNLGESNAEVKVVPSEGGDTEWNVMSNKSGPNDPKYVMANVKALQNGGLMVEYNHGNGEQLKKLVDWNSPNASAERLFSDFYTAFATILNSWVNNFVDPVAAAKVKARTAKDNAAMEMQKAIEGEISHIVKANGYFITRGNPQAPFIQVEDSDGEVIAIYDLDGGQIHLEYGDEDYGDEERIKVTLQDLRVELWADRVPPKPQDAEEVGSSEPTVDSKPEVLERIEYKGDMVVLPELYYPRMKSRSRNFLGGFKGTLVGAGADIMSHDSQVEVFVDVIDDGSGLFFLEQRGKPLTSSVSAPRMLEAIIEGLIGKGGVTKGGQIPFNSRSLNRKVTLDARRGSIILQSSVELHGDGRGEWVFSITVKKGVSVGNFGDMLGGATTGGIDAKMFTIHTFNASDPMGNQSKIHVDLEMGSVWATYAEGGSNPALSNFSKLWLGRDKDTRAVKEAAIDGANNKNARELNRISNHTFTYAGTREAVNHAQRKSAMKRRLGLVK